MTDIKTDPAIIKLLEYAAGKKRISYDEVNDFLPEDITNSDKIEEVITLLEQNNIQLEEDREDTSLKVEESFAGDVVEESADEEEVGDEVEISIDITPLVDIENYFDEIGFFMDNDASFYSSEFKDYNGLNERDNKILIYRGK